MSYFTKLVRIVCLIMLVVAAGLRAGEIHEAVTAGDLNKVRALLEADPSLLESKDKDGDTPLITACLGVPPSYIPQVTIANFLIDKGANINAKNNWSATPLLCVVPKPEDECFDLIKHLIAKGADVNVDVTIMCGAAKSGNIKVAQLLIDHGAAINVNGREGTPLQMAINNNLSISDNMAIDHKLNEEMARLLVESGAKLQEYSFGNTELHLAAIRGFADLVRILVKHGADINAVNEYGHTPLYYAARHGHRQVAEALIAAGANKSAIVETNYGKASQLTETLKEGEAYLWYLFTKISPNIGYAVKTKNHLLIFNPSGINESQKAGLANGYLNPKELVGQKITVLTSYQPPSPYGPDISELAQAMPGANFVLSAQPAEENEGNGDMPPYRLAKAKESFSIDGIQVHMFPACRQLFGSEGFGYLVEADGVKIFHAGLHYSDNNSSNVARFRKEIDFLKPFGPIDIAILPIKGRHLESIAYEPYIYLIDQLAPKAIYLIGEELNTEEHRKCLQVLEKRNVPVFYPDGGIALGQRFHYLRN